MHDEITVAHEQLSFGEKLAETLKINEVFSFYIGNFKIAITETIITTWVVMGVLILLSILATRRLKQVPTGTQSVVEAVVEAINSFVKGVVGHHWKSFAPYLGTVILFLGILNAISIISPRAAFGFHPPFELKPPTKDINITASFAAMTILIVLFAGIRFKGLKAWLKNFIEPIPLIMPMKILEYFIRPLSLALRLFGNILGAFIVMEMIAIVVPVIIPPVFSLYFDIFDGLIQAVVFVFLSTFFIAEAVE